MNDRERQMRLCMYVEKEKKDVRTFLFVRIYRERIGEMKRKKMINMDNLL